MTCLTLSISSIGGIGIAPIAFDLPWPPIRQWDLLSHSWGNVGDSQGVSTYRCACILGGHMAISVVALEVVSVIRVFHKVG